MDAPRIRYATSADGTQIAYAIYGSGPPLVNLAPLVTGGLDLRFRSERTAPFYERLGQSRTVLTLDWRNTGLSGTARVFGMPELIDDLRAVLEHAGFSRFDLMATARPVHIALEYAALEPERVRKLAVANLIGSSGEDWAFGMPRSEAATRDWLAFTTLFAAENFGFTNDAREFFDQMRKHWTNATFAQFMSQMESLNSEHRAPEIRCETLVIASTILTTTSDRANSVDAARRLSSAIERGNLEVTDTLINDPERAELFLRFLADWVEEPRPSRPVEATPSVQTILFTDLEGHTSMMQRLGDSRGRDVLREHERLTREALSAHRGAEVKTMGDGFMASFGSAQRALECAVSLQRAFASREGEPLRIRVGINAGEPIAEDDDLFGSSVIIAARTAAQAKGGEVLVTDVVRQLVAGKGFVFDDRGDTELRGIQEPVRLHLLSWQK